VLWFGIPPRGTLVSLFSVLQLLTEASRVIELRLGMMAVGKASPNELLLMVTEKVEAFQHAGWTMLRATVRVSWSITIEKSSART
jgi:hypothetical protein